MKTLTVLTVFTILQCVGAKAPGLNKNSAFYHYANTDGILTWDGVVHQFENEKQTVLSKFSFVTESVSKVQQIFNYSLGKAQVIGKDLLDATSKRFFNVSEVIEESKELKVKVDGELFPQYDISDFEAEEWFSNSSYNLYTVEFLTGLDLNGTFLWAGNCIGYTLGFIDDTIQFQNNVTVELDYTPIKDIRLMMPLLNFTGMIGSDFSQIPINCYEFSLEFYNYWVNVFAQMNGDINTFIQAFLFTQMGNAQKFKNSIDTIQVNTEVQNYIANFHEYGVIVNLIVFQIQPFTATLDDQNDFDNVIHGFSTYTGALTQITKLVNPAFFNGNTTFSAGERVEAIVTILSSLGMAFAADLHRNNVFNEYQREINAIGQKIMNFDFKTHLERFEHMSYSKEERMIAKQLEEFGADPEVSDFSSRVITYLSSFVLPHFAPEVSAERVDEFTDVWDFASGFKDGVVLVTGNYSLATQCNRNISSTKTVLYDNYNALLNPLIFSTALNEQNRVQTGRLYFQYLRTTLQYPFYTLYSCYWASELLYDPWDRVDVPNFLNERDADGSYRDLTLEEQILSNIVFNLGYIVLDFKWLVEVTSAEADYWYRNGFVAGDIYMRFFFRSLYTVPVR